jgi:hypothetical protein
LQDASIAAAKAFNKLSHKTDEGKFDFPFSLFTIAAHQRMMQKKKVLNE